MARRCQISGKRPLTGNKVSHSNRKSKKRQLPNLQSKRVYVGEVNQMVRVRVSTRALRTIDKKGLVAYLRDNGMTLQDIL